MLPIHFDPPDISPSSPKLREAEREKINEQVREYLSKGKTIHKVSMQTIQEIKIKFNDSIRNERKEFEKARRNAQKKWGNRAYDNKTTRSRTSGLNNRRLS